MTPAINIRSHRGVFYVYVDHKFFCSADTFNEAIRELEREGII